MREIPRWGRVTANANEFLIQMRRGKVVRSGQGLSCFKWPWDSVAVVPTSIAKLTFSADQVTVEKVGVEVRGLAVYRIADPLLAFQAHRGAPHARRVHHASQGPRRTGAHERDRAHPRGRGEHE